MEEELGDVLFALANVARKLSIPPEEALRGSVDRFVARFQYIEEQLEHRGIPHAGASLEEMEALWQEAKRRFSPGEKGS